MRLKKLFFTSGHGIVEYILVTVMVSLAAIAIFRAFRADLQKAYQKAGETLVHSVDDGLKESPGSGAETHE